MSKGDKQGWVASKLVEQGEWRRAELLSNGGLTCSVVEPGEWRVKLMSKGVNKLVEQGERGQ